MFLFKNFIVIFILVGLLSRLLNFLFFRFFKINAIYISYLCLIIVFCPLMAFFVGFDTAVSEYVPSILIWFFFDFIRKKGKL